MSSNGVEAAIGSPRTAQDVRISDRVSDRGRVIAILSDPSYTVPAPAAAGKHGTLAWLRASVSRFSNGDAHDKRRELVRDELTRLAACDLPEMAAVRTRAMLASSDAAASSRIDAIAFEMPVAVLADALGFVEPARIPTLVSVVAPSYFTGNGTLTTDDAVQELLEAALAGPDATSVGAAVARICILVQAHEATGRLIERAVALAAETTHREMSVEAILDEVLRGHPPVAVLRRQDSVGRIIELDVAVAVASSAADRSVADQSEGETPLTFGFGLRRCPGISESIDIATGAVTAIRADRRSRGEA